DVDVCWRLQQAGGGVTFAPGGFVWHHRRETPRAYLRQQARYGEAGALPRLQAPGEVKGRGGGKGGGVLYGAAPQRVRLRGGVLFGASLKGLRLGGDIVYHGTFGSGLFQCLYQRAPAHWAMLPSTLEWHAAAAAAALVGLFWPPAWVAVAVMLGLSLLVAGLQAVQARLAPQHDGFKARCLIMALSYLQPLVRSWVRDRTRLTPYRPPKAHPAPRGARARGP